MVGGLLFAAFISVVVSFVCTEYLVARFSARNRLRVDENGRLSGMLLSNLWSLAILWIGGLVLALVTAPELCGEILLACICIQAVWASRQLWLFRRDHLRIVAYEDD